MHLRSTAWIVFLCASAATAAWAANTGSEGTGAASAPAAGSAAQGADRSPASNGWSAKARPARPPPEPAVIAPAMPPLRLDSATLFQTQVPVPLGERTFEGAAQQWARTGNAPIIVGADGAVMYAYGQSHPILTCAPLRICVLHLIAHEHITNLSIGDSVRWLIQSAQAGAGNNVTPVVIVKPTAADLVTNLAITTDAGRIYYLTLHSDPRKYVPEIGFYDPQQIVIRLAQQRAAADARTEAHQETVVDNLGSVDPATLDFAFACKAEQRAARPWVPLRVFAGGGHTYLQMPDTLAYGDAPAIFNLVKIGHHTQTELINSRLLHGYYVIDGLPTRFKLVVGAGKATRTVTCSHG